MSARTWLWSGYAQWCGIRKGATQFTSDPSGRREVDLFEELGRHWDAGRGLQAIQVIPLDGISGIGSVFLMFVRSGHSVSNERRWIDCQRKNSDSQVVNMEGIEHTGVRCCIWTRVEGK